MVPTVAVASPPSARFGARRLLGALGCILTAGALAAPFAPAQETPTPTPPEGSGPDEPDASLARKAELDARLVELERTAAELGADYRNLIGERVKELARKNATLRRLHEAGIFTQESLTAGLPSEPLAALPWLKKAYEGVEDQAKDYVIRFGGMAKEHNERVALATLKKVGRGQQSYREEDRDGNGIRDYAADLSQLARMRLFEKGAQNGFVANGYVFTILHGDVLTYSATASPENPGESGDSFFYVDQTGVIRAERGKRAGAASPPVPGQ